MKKTLHRFTALALVLVLLAGLCLQALAMWPAPGITSDGDYLDAGTLYGSNGKPIASKTLSIGGFVKLYVLPQGSAKSAYTMTPASVKFNDLPAQRGNTVNLKLNQAYDFSNPVQYNITASDSRIAPVFALAVEGTGGWSGWTDQDKTDLVGMAKLFADTFHEICLTINKIKSAETAVGSYHPANADMLYALGYWLGMGTAFFDDENAGQGGNLLFKSYEDKWQAGGDDAVEFMRTYLEKYLKLQQEGSSGSPYYMKPSALETIYKKIVPFYLNYALNTRIADPVITRVSIDGSVGEVDAANRTVTVRLPAGTNLAAVGEPVIAVADSCKVRNTAGTAGSGTAHETPLG